MTELKHLIIDLETLGLASDCVVLSLGATVFTFETDRPNDYGQYVLDGFYVKFDARDQVARWKRTMDDDTIEWWRGQPEDARAVTRPSPVDVPLLEGMDQFNTWIRQSGYNWKDSFVWSRGTYFDFPKLEHIYKQIGIKPGYNGWKIRDTKTYCDVLTGGNSGVYRPKTTPTEFIKHHALHDAALDAYRLVELFQLHAS